MGLGLAVLPDDDLLDGCLEVAESMARYSPYGLSMTKDVLWANLEVASLEAAVELEDRNQLMLGFTENLPGGDPRLRRRAAHPATRTNPAGGCSPSSQPSPLERPEGAEAGRVEERLGLGDPAASPHGGQVADGGPLVPGRGGPPSTSSSMPWARSQSAWLRSRAGGGSWSTATSQVMSCVPRRLERRSAALVAGGRCAPTPSTAGRASSPVVEA